MTIRFTCGVCGRTLTAPDNAAGTADKCPNCGELVKVPTGSGEPLAELVRQLSATPQCEGTPKRARDYAERPNYIGLRIAATALRVLALLYYVLSIVVLLAVIALIIGGDGAELMLPLLGGMLGAVTAAALLHGLGDAVVALRDIARNSFDGLRKC